MRTEKQEIEKQNEALKAQVEALKAEVESLRKVVLSDEEYYRERFYQINENVKDVVYRFRFDKRTYEYISPQIVDLFGYTAEDFYSQPYLLRHIIHPDYRREYFHYWRGVLKGDIPDYFEMKVVVKGGDIKWVMQKNLAIFDELGNLTFIEGIVTDITERKKTEKALIESEAQKEAILNNFPHLAWMKDCDGIYLLVNKTFAKKYNMNLDDIIGKSDSDIYDANIAKVYRDSDLRVIETKEQLIIEEQTGSSFWETTKAPIFNEKGKVIGVTGVSLDVTERRKREEEVSDYSERLSMQNIKLKLINDELTQAKEKAENADRLKSAFLANMSHEIRTPMNAILGFSTLLRDRELNKDKQKQFIDLINTNSRQLLNIISDIIDISKIESDQIKIFKKDFNINKVLSVLNQNFSEQIKRAGNEVDIVVEQALPDTEAIVYGDKVRIEQVLSNFLSNAIKFCEKGKITCGYKISNATQEIELFVSDTGIGITKEEQEVIFDRFRQVSSSYSKLYGGTGLGLSISKGLVDRMDGQLCVESEVGKGSTFKLILPFKKAAPQKPERIAYEVEYNFDGKTILIAEDELANYTLLESILLPTKAEIVWVKNGVEAIEECKANSNLSLILMDIKMPEMNGLEATKIIRKFNVGIPIIAQTAFAMPQDADNCMRAGCNEYLAKPLQIDDILSKINHYLKEYEATVNVNSKKESEANSTF